MADKADLPLVDPREIRKLLQRVARLGGRMDDKAGMAMTGGIVHACMRSAEALGLSGEDAMTVLAYHALLSHERVCDQLLDQANRSMHPPVVLLREADAAATIAPAADAQVAQLVQQIHAAIKRGRDTADHGLIGNLRCILDHVLPDVPPPRKRHLQ